ncbi:hypothetical protein [Sorangium sp. So ce1024]|uniref:hypothetical protein n=1 Tax=Sorangium sp. So ce1024 TaxID=3133327 RepID=UPI003F11885C
MTIQKKRKVLRAPFVVTVAAAASFAGAVALPGCDPAVTDGSCPETRPQAGSPCEQEDLSCGYGEDGCGRPIESRCAGGAWQDVTATCNPPPPPPACPEAMPAPGDPCSRNGELCSYNSLPDCPEPTVLGCDDGAWSVTVAVFCNPPPPPPGCPVEVPEVGSACSKPGQSCVYHDVLDCPEPLTLACGDDGTWFEPKGSCSAPPPPPEGCLGAATAEACSDLGPACQWLVPGCAEETGTPALPAAGCFPSLPCGEADAPCPAGTSCQEVVVDPCGSASSGAGTCAACGFYTSVCMPSSATVPGG